jgi:aminopeptidase N
MKLLNYPCYILLLILIFSCKSPAVITDQPSLPEPMGLPEKAEEESNPERENPIQYYPKKGLPYQGSRERKFDLLHTSLDLRFDYEHQWVLGRALLDIKPYFYPQDQLELDAKDFDIHDVWLQEGQEKRPLSLNYNQRIATIHLPGTYSSKDTLKIGISYTAKTLENSGKGSAAITDNKGLYFINPEKKAGKPVQIWTQGETEHNSKWVPTIDSPNERATHDIRLTVENKYMTISNGVLASQENHEDGTRTDHWKMDLPHAPYLTAIVVGEFSLVEDSVDNLPLRYLVEEKYAQGAREVFKNTPAMVTFFSALLGVDFPWQKYDQIVVRDFVSGAMENTTASIFMERLNLDEREAIDSEWDYIIAHELFHQWFGNYVTTESWSNLPLNESFADYAEYLWMEHHEGKDPADMHHIIGKENYLSEARDKRVDLIRFQYEDPEDMFDNHSYAKGGRVLHMLRKYLGDEAFFSSLKYYLDENAFSTVEIHDLRLAFEAVTGKDLNWFFNQWFLSSGHPVLDVTFDVSQPENILLTVTQTQDQSLNPLYKIPFEVSWYHNGQKTVRTFFLDQERQQYALENGVKTDLVIFDESQVLLAEKNISLGREILEKQS